MSDVDTMYRHLVRTVRTTFPQFLAQPFELGELYQTILPYRLHRRELGLETNSDYEHTLLELLNPESGYVVLDDRLRDILAADRANGKPDPARIREFASSQLTLDANALSKLDTQLGAPPRASATVSRAAVRAPEPIEPPPSASDHSTKPVMIPEEGGTCQFCKGALPGGRQISYCPHCGQNITVAHCPACGSELEKDWKFCVTCGRSAA